MTKRPETSQEEARRGNRMVEAMYGDVRREKGMPVPVSLEEPVRKHRGPVNEDLAEAGVMSEVSSLLQVHPSVILAIRANSGGAWLKGKNGKDVPVWFYRIVRSPTEVTLVDWWGFARFGVFAIECKRRDWKYTGRDEREVKQQNFINLVRSIGGRAGFATSSLEAQNILEGK